MTFPELDAFTAEAEAVDVTLADVPDDAWERKALGQWNLAELVAHLVGTAARLDEYAAQGTDATDPEHDRVSYWRFDLAAEAPAIAARARERAGQVPPTDLPRAFHEAWQRSAERARGLGPAALVPTLRGPMTVAEYLATRVLEVCVHHMDVRMALDLPPVSTPEAGRVTMAILEGLLGSRRPRNFGRARFILAATGRTPTDDPRFPVLH